MADTALHFEPLEDSDPAQPGDPFARLRYQYGQLLGAEDFAAEQRYFVLRERLLNATLHGSGTVWGLRVTRREDAETNAVQLVCAPGLAVDALGRLVHVEQEVCLDVTSLARAPFWADLKAPPEAAERSKARRAYVVLSYRACLDGQVPAIAPPCSDGGDALAYSRVLDRWRLCLAAEPPPDPHPLARDWTAFKHGGDLQDKLLEFILSKPELIPRFWSGGEDDAPLLLAIVDFEAVGDPVERTRVLADPDNAPRALLPAVQTLASMTTGLRLVGAATAPAAFRLVAASAESAGGKITVTVTLTAPAADKSITPQSVRVLRFDPAAGWVEPSVTARTPSGGDIAIALDEDWSPGTTWQLVLAGGGAAPLVDADGRPLAGVAGDPLPRAGQGRDAALVSRFTP